MSWRRMFCSVYFPFGIFFFFFKFLFLFFIYVQYYQWGSKYSCWCRARTCTVSGFFIYCKYNMRTFLHFIAMFTFHLCTYNMPIRTYRSIKLRFILFNLGLFIEPILFNTIRFFFHSSENFIFQKRKKKRFCPWNSDK